MQERGSGSQRVGQQCDGVRQLVGECLKALGLPTLQVEARKVGADGKDDRERDRVPEAGDDDSQHEGGGHEEERRQRPGHHELRWAQLQVRSGDVHREASGHALAVERAIYSGKDGRATLGALSASSSLRTCVALEARRDATGATAHRDANGDQQDSARSEAGDQERQHSHGWRLLEG